MATSDSNISDPAARRRDTQLLVKHLEFLADNYVDQALVKDALLRGLSQSEAAKLLGMSKKTVNWHARIPYRRYLASTEPRSGERLHFDREFFTYVWGSDDAAKSAIARCQQYDRERLLVESD